MTGKPSSGDARQVDAAFNRVLAAEAEARARVEECRREAAAMVTAAEERVRRLVQRTEARILLAHRLADAGVARELGALRAREPSGGDEEPDGAARAQLDLAIFSLADEIIGHAPETLTTDDAEAVE